MLGVVPGGATRATAGSSSPRTTPTADVNAVTGWALERGIELAGLVVTRPTLEDVFLELAGAEQPAEVAP